MKKLVWTQLAIEDGRAPHPPEFYVDAGCKLELYLVTADNNPSSGPPGHWISVDDEMPPMHKPPEDADPYEAICFTDDVIAMLEDGSVVRTYYDGDVWCHWHLSGCPQYRVTHWMPMPCAEAAQRYRGSRT